MAEDDTTGTGDGAPGTAAPATATADAVTARAVPRRRHPRLVALVTVVAAMAASGAAVAVASTEASTSTAATTVSTARPATTTSTTLVTTTASTEPPAPDPTQPDPALSYAQQRLGELRYDPGPVDGLMGNATQTALYAFQKVQGIAVTGQVDAATQAALANPVTPVALVPDGGANRVEIDLPRQLLFLYDGGQLTLISHVSTGSQRAFCENGTCGDAVTPVGSYRFIYRKSGWAEGPLGSLYNPVFFTRTGIAIHGSLSVPLYPASHGCVRIPMHIAEYFTTLVGLGEAVYVYDGSPLSAPGPATSPTLPPDEVPAPELAPEAESTTTVITPPDTTTTLAPTTVTTAPTTSST